jgi:hypothetical protein
MTDDTKSRFEFQKVMNGLAGNFGGIISADDIALRFLALQEYDLAEIRQAATKLITKREAKFPPVPTVKEMIDEIHMMKGEAPKNHRLAAQGQASMILNTIKEHGHNYAPAWEDPITKRIMQGSFDYRTMSRTLTETDEKWFIKDFCELYEVLSRAETKYSNQIAYQPVQQYLPELREIAPKKVLPNEKYLQITGEAV